MLYLMFQLISLLLFRILCLDLQIVNNKKALCLDGSQASFYYGKGYDESKNNFLFFFEGGNLVLNKTEAGYLDMLYEKTATIQGSSINRPSQIFLDGLLSENNTINPQFYNWNIIYINYCDGSIYQGFKNDPILINQTKLFFRGEIIVKSIFNKFIQSLINADVILLTGCGLGGIASMLWQNYLRSIVSYSVPILNVIDSGVLFDLSNISNQNLLEYSLSILSQIVNNETNIPNNDCALYYPNQQWKCFYISNLIESINEPIFIIQSLYDTKILSDYLNISCVINQQFNQCTQDEWKIIENTQNTMKTTINNIIQNNKYYGSFAPSCVSYCFSLNSTDYSEDWLIPSKIGQTFYQTLENWITFILFNTTNSQAISQIDSLLWPNNKACSYQILSSIILFYIQINSLILII